MLRKIVLPLITLIALASCKDNKKEVVYLNNELTTINDSLFYKGQAWGEELRIAIMNSDYTQLQPARMSVQAFIENSIEHVHQMENVGGSDEFRRVELEYLQFERDTIMPKMMQFESLDSTATEKQINDTYQSLVSCARQEQEQLKQIRTVQKAYADKNKIELKESSLSHVE